MNEKVHYKMYKSGKQWLIAGAAVFALAAPVVATGIHEAFSPQTVSAAETSDATDTQAPTVYADPMILNIGDQFRPLDNISAYDAVDGDVTNSVKILSNNVDMTKAGVYTVTYQASDKAGNVKNGSFQVTVVDPNAKDTTPPVITAISAVIKKGSSFTPLDEKYVSVTDNHDGDMSIQTLKVISDDVDTSKAGVYHVTYQATDAAGNTSEATSTITVSSEDSSSADTAPSIVASDVTIHAGDNWDAAQHAHAYPGTISTDVVSLSSTGTVDTSKPGSYSVVYTATNQRGETSTKKITVTVIDAIKDTTPPVISDIADIVLNQGNAYTPSVAGASAYDSHDGDVPVYIVSSDVDTSKAGTYHIVYGAKDAAGNESTKTITVTVKAVADTTVPVISASDLSIDQGSSFDPLKNVSATDNVDGTTAVKVESNNVDTSKPGSYQVTYSATDKAGNKATKTITVTVVDKSSQSKDTTAPVINASDIQIDNNENIDPLKNVTATDDVDGAVPVVVLSNDVNANVKGVYHITYQASDAAGNKATKTITVTVTKNKDTTAPVIYADDLTITQGSTFDANTAASAIDDTDGDLRVTVESNDVDTSTPGTYQVTYSATDKAGNKATKTIAVTVTKSTKDTTKPVIKVVDINVVQGNEFNPLSLVTATDDVDGVLTPYVISNDVDTSKTGTYDVTVGAKDAAGNEATATYKVTVIAKDTNPDTIAPKITVTDAHLAVGETFDYTKYVSVTDNDDANPKVTVTPVSVDTSKAGTTKIQITAVDASGNVSTATMNVIVTDDSQKDTTAPVITANDVTLSVGDSFNAVDGVSAMDETDGKVDVKVVSTDVDLTKAGKYHVTYSATDKAGNEATKTITVTVVDKTPTDNGGTTPSTPDNGSHNNGSTNTNTNTNSGSSNSSQSKSGTSSASQNSGAKGSSTLAGDASTVSNKVDPSALSDENTTNSATDNSSQKSSQSADDKSSKDNSKSSLPEASATPKSNTIMQIVMATISAMLISGIVLVTSKLKKR